MEEGDGLGLDDSPWRSTFQQLNNLDNPRDITDPGSSPSIPFAGHVLNQIAAEQTLPGTQPSQATSSSTRQSTSRGNTSQGSEPPLSSLIDEDDEAALREKLEAVKAHQAKEVDEAAKLAQEKKKKKLAAQELADRKKHKEERAKKCAALEKKLLDKMEKKHQVTLAAIRDAAGEDDSVFTEPSHSSGFLLGVENPPSRPACTSKSSRISLGHSSGSRNKSRVSFDVDSSQLSPRSSPRSSRSNSERPDRDFHP